MDELTAVRDLRLHLAPDELEPPARLRAQVLTAAVKRRSGWRRRRSLILAGAAVAACAAAVAPAVLAPHPERPAAVPVAVDPSPRPTTTGNAGQDCSSGVGRAVTADVARELLYLPPAGLTGPVSEKPAISEDVPACSAPTTGGTWYRLGADGRVDRNFTVRGPDSPDYYAQPGGPEMGGGVTSAVSIQGRPGTLHYSRGSRLGRLFWTTADGSRWQATGTGMTAEEVVAAALSTEIVAGRVDSPVVPAGLTDALLPQAVPASLNPGVTVNLGFGTVRHTSLSMGLEPARPDPAGAPVGSRPVDINGVTGWLSRNGDGSVGLEWAPATGVYAGLTLNGTSAQALALARATTRVGPGDPRLR